MLPDGAGPLGALSTALSPVFPYAPARSNPPGRAAPCRTCDDADMTDLRTVSIERISDLVYLARNDRGGELRLGSDDGDTFSPVELLLAALAGCTAVDVDLATTRRAVPESFTAVAEARSERGPEGNILRDLSVTFTVTFPEGPEGDAARAVLPRALEVSHERACTVSRTIEAGEPVTMRLT